MDVQQKVYRLVSRIPHGKVTTYGKIAQYIGVKSPRLIGKILHENFDPVQVPCHRVVNAEGRVADHYAFGGARGQSRKLRNEGIMVVDRKVDLKEFLWEK